MGRSRVSGRVWRRSREVGAGCRTAHGCEHSYANPGTGRGFERVRRALRRLRPRCLQPCLPADRGLVDGRGRDGRDLHGGVAPAGQGRPGGRFPAAVAAGHRHQHRAQPVPEQPAVPGGGAGGRGGRTVGARPRRGGRGPPRRPAAPRAGAHGPGVTASSGARGHRALPGEGLDYEAAAEALGIPVGTVASRLSRARKKLRRKAEAALALPQLQSRRRHLGGEAAATALERNLGESPGKREVGSPRRQTRGDHAHAIRPAQEGNR